MRIYRKQALLLLIALLGVSTPGWADGLASIAALVIKLLAAKVGLDASRYAGHSLRSGFLTSAARNRASIFKMADQSRHRSLDVLRDYVRNEARFDDHAGYGLLGRRDDHTR